ncbi:hypothetical protein FB451DRAFT_8205 [Mycena latifolia]|nr:hypothetical protein FB451DRAFT_8205 [Mycena latifolia]
MEDNGRELELELSRRRLQRQLHRTMDTERETQREDPHEWGSSVSRAARYLESGLVDPREASQPVPSTSAPGGERRLRPPLDTSNPFNVTWGPRRGTPTTEDDAPASRPAIHRSRSRSQSRESNIDWISRTQSDEGHTNFDTFDEWFNSEPPSSRANSRTAGPSSEGLDFLRGTGGEGPGSGEFWRARNTGAWQPRLAVSPQSTALPARTATHARAQSIPASSLSPLSSIPPQPSLHRLRSRLYGSPRAASIGSTNSLVAENAAVIRRREARTELMERLNRTMALDIDTLSDPESDWEPRMRPRARNPPRPDEEMDSEDDGVPLHRRVAEAIELIGSRQPPASIRGFRLHRRNDSSPPRQSRSSAGRVTFEEEEEQPIASSSGLNSRRPLSLHPRRTVQRLRQHPISGEISPPPPASATVDRRHASWEVPSQDAGVSSTYQYLSALSHGFDSQSLSISDLAHTITSNSHTEEARRSPSSPMWGENESPFSTLFGRSPTTPFSHRHARHARGQDMPGGYPDDAMDASEDSSVPSLPPPDLGRNFERAEDVLRSNADGARASSTVATPSSDSPSTSYTSRPTTPPSANPYTGPFRLTMQRREEFSRRRSAGNQRRIPDPPSIPPLYFGRDFENPATLGPSEEGSGTRVSVTSFSH